MNEYLEIALEAAKRAGKVLLDHLGKVDVREKKPRDLVTQADLDSQEMIEQLITERFPEHLFLGEESNTENSIDFDPSDVGQFDAEYAWIVDPLDGTTNFVHQLRSFSVSIALTQNKVPIVGVVYDPLCDECFHAAKGEGAFLNGKRIEVSDCEQLHDAMVVTGFSPSVTKESIEAKRFLEVLGKAQTIRRLGSAALNLCFLACGRVDAYWASSLNAWDIAAGLLILSESGGKIRPISGDFDMFHPEFVASSTLELGAEIHSVIDIAE